MKIISNIKKYINSRCWHNFEKISSFEQGRQNNYERPIIVENQECSKCKARRQQKFWKDLY